MAKDISTEFNEESLELEIQENTKFIFDIEDVLSSKGRILILKILAELEELNISAIARVTNLNHNTTAKHLEFLKKADLVQEKRFGRIKIFRFKLENIRAKSLKRLFEIWNE